MAIHSECINASIRHEERENHTLLQGSLVPRLSGNVNMYRRESLVSLLRKHDVIKIGLKQKGNVLHVVQPTVLQC